MRYGLLLSLLTLSMFSKESLAVNVNWTVQSASSSLTLSGDLVVVEDNVPGDIFIFEWPEGSLTTTYGGNLETEISLGVHGPTSIEFLSANLAANNNGDRTPEAPLGTGVAPANYGFGISDTGFGTPARAAIRELATTVTSSSLSLSGSPLDPQAFSGNLDFEFLSGHYVAREGTITGEIIAQLAPELFFSGIVSPTAVSGTITYEGSLAVLTIPLSLVVVVPIDLSHDPILGPDSAYLDLTFTGAIVATTPVASVPEANALFLLSISSAFVGYFANRRRLQQ